MLPSWWDRKCLRLAHFLTSPYSIPKPILLIILHENSLLCGKLNFTVHTALKNIGGHTPLVPTGIHTSFKVVMKRFSHQLGKALHCLHIRFNQFIQCRKKLIILKRRKRSWFWLQQLQHSLHKCQYEWWSIVSIERRTPLVWSLYYDRLANCKRLSN